ncbi:hypothetical protein [Sulfolobus tengchongensis spindle-shaped virus 3]|nr:hypothetical protein [Sulfolobus tengchongensis spindle-shaped virus 3]
MLKYLSLKKMRNIKKNCELISQNYETSFELIVSIKSLKPCSSLTIVGGGFKSFAKLVYCIISCLQFVSAGKHIFSASKGKSSVLNKIAKNAL